MPDLVFADRPVRLTRRRDARRLTLRLAADGRLLLTAPRRVRLSVIEQFINRQLPFIAREEQKRRAAVFVPAEFRAGTLLPYFGRRIELCFSDDEDACRGAAKAGLDGRGGILLPDDKQPDRFCFIPAMAPAGLTVNEAARRAYLHLLKTRLAAQAEILTDELWPRLLERSPALSRPTFRVQRLTASWGRCRAASGLITLNMTLALFDLEIVRAIVAHELCHLVIPAHSASFYEMLTAVCPGCEDAVQRLKAMPYARIDEGYA